MQHLGIWFVLLALHATQAAAMGTVQVPTTKASDKPPPYELISYVSEGKPYGPVSEAIRGRYHRIVVVSGGIAYNHPTLRLETLTYGDEGCCIRLLTARDLPLDRLREQGLDLPKATEAEFTFTRWLHERSFAFRYGNLACRVGNVGGSTVSVACGE